MKWKIGDKVRLTGEDWGTDNGDDVYTGAELRITGINDEGDVQLETGRYHWGLHEGWEIELVEREEKTMSVDFSEVNVGDKVRLTRENGDGATFIVESRSNTGRYITSETNTYAADSWDTLEIVERAFKPVPGLYSNGREAVMVTEKMEVYFHSLTWIPANPDAKGTVTYDAVREKGVWERVVTF